MIASRILLATSLAAAALWSARSGAHRVAPAYQRMVRPVEVRDTAGQVIAEPFLGGFNNPRPQLVDIDGDGDADLFVLETKNDLMFFENVGNGQFVWRSDAFQGVEVGEWFRFADLNGDGLMDLLCEQPIGYVRVYRNTGTKTAPRLELAVDSLRDADGTPIFADPQNILNVVDIDHNGRPDLFLGRITGTVDRFEQVSTDANGIPRFRLIDERWEGIEIVGAMSGAPPSAIDTSGATGPSAGSDATSAGSFHGANTMAFGDLGRGLIDLLWGDYFEAGLLLIENHGTPTAPSLRSTPTRFPVGNGVITSGYNAASIGDVDGNGLPDVVMGVVGGAFNPNRTTIDNLYLITQRARGTFDVASAHLISMIDIGSESALALADLDGDGDLDIIAGNRIAPDRDNTATVTWFENTGSRTRPAFRQRGFLPITGAFSYAPAVADIDGDGMPDLLVGTWTDRVEWYRNAGTRASPTWTRADSMLVRITRGSNTMPTVGDIDGDGLPDLVVGEASGELNVYRNTGTMSAPKFELVSDHFQDIKVARRSAPHLADMDGDGRADLLIGAEDGSVQLWKNTGARGAMQFTRDASFALRGDNNAAPAVGDLRGNGSPVVLLGGAGGGFRWFERETARP